MTRVTLFKDKEGNNRGFDVRGHAGFLFRGLDIVCSAISILSINTINAVEAFTEEKPRVSVKRGAAQIRYRIDSIPGEQAKLLLDTYELGIRSIEQEYSRHVQVQVRRYEK
ncbi:MAG: ribosomal-processing cysteine protease Prp [Lachnospiraceae bacterium]|nr:ribosomal-processing cysteine protease Prp [Lachnospiraceae bacterium]